MEFPGWLKPALYGAAGGAVLTMVVGFSWGNWMTGGGADKMAADLAKREVTAALVPVCLDMSTTDPQRAAKLVTIREAATFKRRDAVMDTGWATVPGSDAPDRDLAEACIDALDINAS